MAWTLQQLTALETAMASGELECKFADKTVKYHSLTEMRDLRDQMRRELIAAGAISTPNGPRSSGSVVQYSRD